MDAPTPTGTLFGMTATDFGTLLAALATLATLYALYAVMTVRDPMAKRVKALNERREQLKAGITASTAKRRAKLVNKNQTTDQMRSFLTSLKVLTTSSRTPRSAWPRPASAPRTGRSPSSSAA